MFDDPGPERGDEETAATDGEPTSLEEVRKRQGRSVADRAAANGGDPEPGEEGDDEPEQWEFFPVEEDGKTVTLGKLVKAGTPVEVRYKMTGKSIPNVRGGIMDPYATSALLVADVVVDDVKTQFVRDENQKVEKVIQYVTVKPRIVQNAATEAGRALLRGEPASHPTAAEA
jgi:hypothetical protein